MAQKLAYFIVLGTFFAKLPMTRGMFFRVARASFILALLATLALVVSGTAYVLARRFLDNPAVLKEAEERIEQVAKRYHLQVDARDLSLSLRGRLGIGELRILNNSDTLATLTDLRIDPSWRALWRGHLQPKGVYARTVHIFRENWTPWLRQRPTPKASTPKHSADELTNFYINIDNLFLNERSALTDIELDIERTAGQWLIEGDSRAGEFQASIERVTSGQLNVGLRELDIDLSALAQNAFFRSLRTIERGSIQGTAQIEISQMQDVKARCEFAARGIHLSGPLLAEEEIGPLSFYLQSRVQVQTRRSKIQLADLSIAVGEPDVIVLKIAGDVDLADDLQIHATLPETPLDKLLATLPEMLQPPPSAPQLKGFLRGELLLIGATRDPASWEVSGGLDLSELSAAVNDGTNFTLQLPNNEQRPLVLSSENPEFVPFQSLPRAMVRALTTAEDAGFFAHQGFDFQELKNSFVAVKRTHKPVRGGSTLTQQLAKNFYLSREKTFLRKGREALVALALETAFSKSRLFEMYVNSIEWGPGVFGIYDAAHFYFNKHPSRLSLKECVFLAAIIPNPNRYARGAKSGEVSEFIERRIQDILEKMAANGYITQDEMVQASSEQLFTRKS